MSGVPGDLAHWQQQLAETLLHLHGNDTGTEVRCLRDAVALLSVLEAYGDARAAQALTDAAEAFHGPDGPPWDAQVPPWLRDRAAALQARTDTEGANDDGRC